MKKVKNRIDEYFEIIIENYIKKLSEKINKSMPVKAQTL